MSKGRPIVATRIDQDLLDELDQVVEELFLSPNNRQSKQWHKAEFLRIAIREKLDKVYRGRGQRKRTGGSVSDDPPAV